MSSTNKTQKLGLNSWTGSDRPERADFNRDNAIIDTAIKEHTEDEDIHITAEERNIWTNFFYIGVYYGNGELERVIETECPFDVGFGFIFADNKAFSTVYFNEKQKRNYAGVFYRGASSMGIHLDRNNNLSVKLSATADFQNEYANFNERGVVYHYFLFRDCDAS